MSDHETLVEVAARWERLYEERCAEIERLKRAAADHAMSENYTLEGQAILIAGRGENERLREENTRLREALEALYLAVKPITAITYPLMSMTDTSWEEFDEARAAALALGTQLENGTA